MISNRMIKTFLQSRSIRPYRPERILKSITDCLPFRLIRRRTAEKPNPGAPAMKMIPMISTENIRLFLFFQGIVRTIKGLIYFG